MGLRWLGWLTLALLASPAAGLELSGSAGVDLRGFFHPPQHPGQRPQSGSAFIQPEFYWSADNDRNSVVLTPFLRVDSADPERTHADLREFLYQHVGENWELRAGIGKVFWGVVETRHLVDIINQTDLVENVDGDEKLGQPMVNISFVQDWGTMDAFLLPYFRERTFPGERGRLRSEPRVEADAARYESGAARHRMDWAIRYSHAMGNWDIGLAHFHGTSREPALIPTLRAGGAIVLEPLYRVIHQTSLELQATLGSWLWKLEAIHRSGDGETFNAVVGGFEYTFYGIGDSSTDVGMLLEGLYDDRGERAPHPFEGDIFIGARIALNDEYGTEVLGGLIRDINQSTTAFTLEASRRLDDAWTLEAEARIWTGVATNDPQRPLRNDDYVQISLRRYF